MGFFRRLLGLSWRGVGGIGSSSESGSYVSENLESLIVNVDAL